ncbi:MAG: hypothetical protein CMF52_08005 [Legionellales bacterium]|nr:hypothetical protein [Legionellales bacterium]
MLLPPAHLLVFGFVRWQCQPVTKLSLPLHAIRHPAGDVHILFFYRLKKMERLKKQIRDNYFKAFDDLLEKSLVDQDFEWIIQLFDELRIRIAQQIPKRVDLHQKIAEEMDVTIFGQMLKNNCYKGEDLYHLIEYVFGWFEKLQAPARDASTAEEKRKVLGMLQTSTFGKIVPAFLRAAHTILDTIEDDKKEFQRRMAEIAAQKK